MVIAAFSSRPSAQASAMIFEHLANLHGLSMREVHGLEGGKVHAWAALRRVCMLAALFQHTFRTGNRQLYAVLLGYQRAIPAFPWETFSAGNWERFCLGEFCAEGGLWCSCDKQENLYKAVATFVEGNMDALPSNVAEECAQLSSILSGRRQWRRKATGA